jgi:hypothetical protein
MEHKPGDFLIFQLESAFALLRILAIDGSGDDRVWHLAGYSDLFFEIDEAEKAAIAGKLTISHPHLALTNRGFASTQVARLAHTPIQASDLAALEEWRKDGSHKPADRSVRLLMGVR